MGLIQADARHLPLANQSVHCCVTSPPYFGLRDYGISGQIGLEQNIEDYVAGMVAVGREIWRVLRDDGTLWLNLGDSYSQNEIRHRDGTSATRSRPSLASALNQTGHRIGTNFLNCFESSVKGSLFFIRGRCTLTITTAGKQVLPIDHLAPDGKFTRLLGVQLANIKDGDNNLGQILYLLDNKVDTRIGPGVRWRMVDSSHLEIILDVDQCINVVVSDSDLDTEPALIIPITSAPTIDAETALTIEETDEPPQEVVSAIHPPRDAFAPDTLSKGRLDINMVDDSIPFGNALTPDTKPLRDLRVTIASTEKFSFTCFDARINLTVLCVGHLFASNHFGSLIHYEQLYDQAKRKSNARLPKQQLGIPDMIKRALMEDGWICRSTIIWNKPNCLPESVRDRCTRSYEHIFMFSKQPRYYFDAVAIAEPSTNQSGAASDFKRKTKDHLIPNQTAVQHRLEREPTVINGTRNKRDVWTVNTSVCKEAHFATFPPALITPCILAGTSDWGVCPICGAPWVRVVERTVTGELEDRPNCGSGQMRASGTAGTNGIYHSTLGQQEKVSSTTLSWRPTCDHEGEPIGAVVLDPFCGSGTTGQVCNQHRREFIGLDLSYVYLHDIASKRVGQMTLRGC